MKESFQAKDIQEILKIPKHRYEYLASKIGISAEVEAAAGQGTVKRFSFKNLVEFAVIDRANSLGLDPKSARGFISFLNQRVRTVVKDLFSPTVQIDLQVHYINAADKKYYKISGQSVSAIEKKAVYPVTGFEESLKISQGLKNLRVISMQKIKEEMDAVSASNTTKLEDFEGSVMVNIGLIKNIITRRV